MPGPAQGVWAIVPVKPFLEAKSRTGLSQQQRAEVSRRMFDHVCAILGDVLPSRRVIVTSRDADALAAARALGMRALRERPSGSLNDALAAAMAEAHWRGACSVLSVSTDLPGLLAEDLEAMLVAFAPGRLVIAPDTAGSGTNALLMAPRAIPYLHGSGSFWRHVDAARDAGMAIEVVARPGLMHDIDTPCQIARYLADLAHKRIFDGQISD